MHDTLSGSTFQYLLIIFHIHTFFPIQNQPAVSQTISFSINKMRFFTENTYPTFLKQPWTVLYISIL